MEGQLQNTIEDARSRHGDEQNSHMIAIPAIQKKEDKA
jgi:hypothetical protein